MPRSDYLRAKAEECRRLAKIATAPETVRQLLLWAVELEEEADEAEVRNC